jgi:hypothetical protein
MATIVTGTHERSDRHSTAVAPMGFLVSMAIVVGIAGDGWGAISWTGILWAS